MWAGCAQCQREVIMYADKITESIRKTLEITEARRKIQEEYNQKHGITPRSVKREISLLVEPDAEETATRHVAEEHGDYLTPQEVDQKVKFYEIEMKRAAKEMRFEDAAHFRDLMRKYQEIELSYG